MTSLVQTAIGNTSAGANTIVSATFPSAPTPGNLLVAVLNLGATTVPSATTPWGAPVDASSVITASVRTYVFSKVAQVGESATVIATLGSSQATHKMNLYEFSPTAGKQWAGVDQTIVSQDAGSAITSLSTGTSPSTTSGDGVSVVGVCLSATSAGFAMTNGYTVLPNPTVSPIGFSGHLILTAPGTQETTSSWTTARRVAAALVAYKQSAASASGSRFLSLL